MPIFEYTAKIDPGRTETGSIDAESEAAAVQALKKQGLYVLSIKPAVSVRKKKTSGAGAKELTAFTRKMANLLKSGFTLSRALPAVAKQTKSPFFREVLNDIFQRVNQGEAFSQALGAYPRMFSPFFVSMVQVGEKGGRLDQALLRLAEAQERRDEIRAQVRSALAYPLFLLAVGTLAILVLVTFVIPQLTLMFEDLGQTLPFATRAVIAASSFMSSFWWVIVLGICAVIILGRHYYTSEKQRLIIDRMLLRIPGVRSLYCRIETANYSYALSVLLENGVRMLDALAVAATGVSNRYVREKCLSFGEEIRQGRSLSQCLTGDDFFPPEVTNMIAVGEESGEVAAMLANVAETYEKEVNAAVKALVSLIEPLLILIMGTVIAFLAVSMLLPVFNLNLLTD